MVDVDHIRQIYESYPKLVSAAEVDAIVDLYADDAKIEDPIGSPLHEGRDAIRSFYEASIGAVTMRQTGPIRVAGTEAAVPLVVVIGAGDDRKALDIISTMVFDDAGKITRMRAFWSFAEMRDARPDE
jgi:steroid delta-isomerase